MINYLPSQSGYSFSTLVSKKRFTYKSAGVDIDAGETIIDKGSGEMQGEFNFLDVDFNTKTYFSNTVKRVK